MSDRFISKSFEIKLRSFRPFSPPGMTIERKRSERYQQQLADEAGTAIDSRTKTTKTHVEFECTGSQIKETRQHKSSLRDVIFWLREASKIFAALIFFQFFFVLSFGTIFPKLLELASELSVFLPSFVMSAGAGMFVFINL